MRVSIVVTAYLQKTKPYLDLCVESIRNLRYSGDLEIIIVSPKWYAPQYEGIKTISPPEVDYVNARACNFGIENAAGDYFLLLNDDVILTRDSLDQLVECAEEYGSHGIFMPISNDQQGRYALNLGIWPRPYKIEDVHQYANQMMNMSSPYPMGIFIYQTLCLYAVLIPRKVYEQIGGFDETNKGYDDTDYCLRVGQQGMFNGICLSSLVFHAGGVSADHTFTPEDRNAGREQFQKKWGRS